MVGDWGGEISLGGVVSFGSARFLEWRGGGDEGRCVGECLAGARGSVCRLFGSCQLGGG